METGHNIRIGSKTLWYFHELLCDEKTRSNSEVSESRGHCWSLAEWTGNRTEMLAKVEILAVLLQAQRDVPSHRGWIRT